MDKEEKIVVIILGIISCSALIIACVALHNTILNKNNIKTTDGGSYNPQDENVFTPRGRKVLDTIP